MVKITSWFIVIGNPICCIAMLFMAYLMSTVSQVGMTIMFISLSALFALATPVYYHYLIKGGKK